MRIGSLCSGYGGLELGAQAVYGGTTAWVSDIDKGACKILAHRFPGVPNIGDMTAVDWAAVEPVDLICGGTPCQDLSHAGKRAGMTEGTRSNLWVAMREAIAVIRPRYVVWENVRGAASAEADSDLVNDPRLLAGVRRRPGQPLLRALGRVVGDLSDLGYVGQVRGLRAADVGAPHGRFRYFIAAEDAQGGRRGPSRNRDSEAGPDRAPVGPGDRASTDAGGARLGQHRRGAPAQEAGAIEGDSQQSRSLAGMARREELLPTPSVADVEGGRKHRSGVRAGELLLNGVAHHQSWGDYAAAIGRWEHILGRTAPAPTMTSAKGNSQLAPPFVEWMMGLPAGWVTDVPGITRNEALRALGNGVVPQQAAEALRVMASWSAAA